jgi:uncharacterized protein with HXXEE motif
VAVAGVLAFAPMTGTIADRRFGYAWLAFAGALAIHVLDEATHDFLSTYNPAVLAIRARIPILPLPTFTFGIWLSGLLAGLALLFSVSPLAFRGVRWMRLAALTLSIVVGVFNASLHLLSSAYFRRWMPGAYSSPLLLAAALFLFVSARNRKTHPNPGAVAAP